ncbi:MAG: hypothetical protein ACLRIS_07020 [Flavonifractor plautii]
MIWDGGLCPGSADLREAGISIVGGCCGTSPEIHSSADGSSGRKKPVSGHYHNTGLVCTL